MSPQLRINITYLLFALMAKTGLFPIQSWVTSGVMAGALAPFLYRRWARYRVPDVPYGPGHPLWLSALHWLTAPALFAMLIVPYDGALGHWLVLSAMGIGLVLFTSFHSQEGLFLSIEDQEPRFGLVTYQLSPKMDKRIRILVFFTIIAVIWDPVVPRAVHTGMRLGKAMTIQYLIDHGYPVPEQRP